MQIWQRHLTTYRKHTVIKTENNTPLGIYKAMTKELGYEYLTGIAMRLYGLEFISLKCIEMLIEDSYIEIFQDGVILWLD